MSWPRVKAGASDAETVVYEATSSPPRSASAKSKPQGVGSRAIGCASTSPPARLSPINAPQHLVLGLFVREHRSPGLRAVTLARITSEDPFAGLPSPKPSAAPRRPALYFEDVNLQPPSARIEIARVCEAAALAYDPRIRNSGGGDFDAATAHKVLINSRALPASSPSYCGFPRSPSPTTTMATCSATTGTPRAHHLLLEDASMSPGSCPPHPAQVGCAAGQDPARSRGLFPE